eukprot:TRINITY_DN65877_c10_g1_i1.p1 TRINITY_DN65877_c10_g1~~TRINITY_DN65877_c10_g1_i1.p1  ORF type:complete len:778 (-),score=302.33 TRINITY_DN65877_c10_g1_i1:41-2374(-)
MPQSFFHAPRSPLLADPTTTTTSQSNKNEWLKMPDNTGTKRYSHQAWCSACRQLTFHGHVANWKRYAWLWTALGTAAMLAALRVMVSTSVSCWQAAAAAACVARLVVRRGREAFQCQRCCRLTLRCRSCTEAMATVNHGSKWLPGSDECLACQTGTSWSTIARQPKRMQSQDKGASRFDQYAPPRPDTTVKPLVDGEAFFEACADAIEQAESSIYMSFWHMSDKIYLRRRREHRESNNNNALDDRHRFDMMLKRKAQQGVQVYILLWKEKSRKFWLDNFSAEMAETMQALHPNIHVIRHGHPAWGMTLWSHHQKFVVVDELVAIVGGFDVCLGRYDTPAHELWDVSDASDNHERQTWPGIDYYNPHVRRPESVRPFFRDCIDRSRVHRMPWHDVDVLVDGQAAHDVARTFVQRWNHHADRVDRAQPRIVPHPYQHRPAPSVGTCVAQVVRSQAEWSGETNRTDCSLYEAHVRMIELAQHFIYIENQYFACSMAGNVVRNQIGHALLNKLREMIRAKRTFRVIFMVPQPEETGEGALAILHWLYRSVNRGGSSLLERLAAEFPSVDLNEYIGFYCLRTHALLPSDKTKAVTENIYLHSKLMIVDDNTAIVSSANLNDRSLLGDRDSEIGVVWEDTTLVESVLNGERVQVSANVRAFRLALWREHLGFDDDSDGEVKKQGAESLWDVCDSRVFHGIWNDTARRNSAIYEAVFPTIPSDRHTTLRAFKSSGGLQVPAPCSGDVELLSGVRGKLVLHPIRFMLHDHIETQLEKFIGHRSCQ